MTRIRASALSAISGCVLLLAGCASSDGASLEAASPGSGVPVVPNPWVQGGQTGALMPPCGLTPAARFGDSIPGGDSGIVVHTQSCVGFVAAELELRDENGNNVEFDVEQLPGGAVLLRPRAPLSAGVYRLKVAGMEMEPVVAEAPPDLPMQLGTLHPPAQPICGASATLNFDPLVLPYLPQLKLSVSVDGGEERTWFDYGELEVTDGRALLSLPCGGQQCLADGVHTLRVTGELAGELGTLAPVDVNVETRCLNSTSTSSAPAAVPPPDSDDGGAEMDCGIARSGGKPVGSRALHWLGAVLGLLAVRRARRSSA